jgi:hypothetical protein
MRKTGTFIVFLSFILTACGSGAANSSRFAAPAYNAAKSEAPESQTTGADAAPAAYSSNTAVNAAPKRVNVGRAVLRQAALSKADTVADTTYDTDRKVIRNADIELESDSPEESQRTITSIAETMGGFVVESQQSSSDVRSYVRDIATMTVRVPADKFNGALDQIRSSGKRVVLETVKGQDVTEEFIDIEAQLKAKKALEAQFMEIMKRAKTIDEALDVQTQLADVRGEIERIEGRKRFLENQSSLSTIKIRLQTAKVIAASTEGLGGRFGDAFAAGFEVATNFLLGLVTLIIAVLPFALIFGLPSVLVFRYFWKRAARRRTAAEIAKEELKTD